MSTYALQPSSASPAGSNLIVYLARAGYAARGAVYVMVGGLALLSAVGMGGATKDSKGALTHLMDSPGGWVVLLLIGLGLIGYAIWRFIQGALDVDDHGTKLKGLAVRAGLLISAVTHLFLAGWAVMHALGRAVDAGDESGAGREGWTAWLLDQPFGPWLVAAVGIAIVGAGVAQIVKGWKNRFKRYMDIPYGWEKRATPICRYGLMARGVSFVIIGAFFLFAAWSYDPQQAGGLKQVFDTIRSVAFGQILLAAMALGLLSFAAYSFLQARYRRIETH